MLPCPIPDAPERALRVVAPATEIDLPGAERAAAQFLRAVGISPDSPGLRGTPGRMARACAELFTSPDINLTTFANDEGYGELVLAHTLALRAGCEHHLPPFVGVAHVGYLPRERIVALSELGRVEHFAARPQVPRRLTTQIAGWLRDNLDPEGVGVVIEAEHPCRTLRGIRAAGCTTVTSALLGTVRDDPRSRQEFFALTRGRN